MRFRQLDKITLLEPGKRIQAEKRLTGQEDYLRDHFPRFAVMPGVLMLESLYQASQILVRETEGYRSGLVVLRTAKNVKFADFMQPGDTLHIDAEILKTDGCAVTLKATGTKSNGSLAVSGRLVVESVQEGEPNSVDIHASGFIRQFAQQLQQAAME